MGLHKHGRFHGIREKCCTGDHIMQYTIVVPVHNEASNIDALVTRFIEGLQIELAAILREIIIVENGSTDGTLEACRCLERRFPNLIRGVTIPRGSYGEAIKLGIL